jgi:UDPglucose 6-dehydrogenase
MERFKREHPSSGVHVCEDVYQVLEDCDAVVLVTEWTEYRELDWARVAEIMREKVVLDGRLVLDRDELTSLGFRYVGLNG